MKKTLIFLSLFTLLTACGKLSPLEQLKSDVRLDTMNNAFWADEQEKNTPLWHQGLTYCKANNEKPNCAPLMQVYVFSNGIKTAPAIGHSGHTIELPDYKSTN